MVHSLVFPKWQEGAESIRENRVNPTPHSIVSHLFLYQLSFHWKFWTLSSLSKSLLFSRVKTRHICAFSSVSFLASYHSMSLLLLGKLLKKVNAPSLSLHFQLISQPKANWLQFYLIIKLKLLSPKLLKTFSLLNQMIISFEVSSACLSTDHILFLKLSFCLL